MEHSETPAQRNLSCALDHARRGRRVFPCSPRNKLPVISKALGGQGFHDATTDLEQIRQWWADYPDAVFGMPTGAESGVFVLDVDVKSGKCGEDTLQALMDTFGPLPETREAITASGGRHLYFRHPRGDRHIPNKGSRLGTGFETWGRNGYPAVPFDVARNGELVTPDVDIRGDGGYVILPGSQMHDGREYRWADGSAAVADAPAWLLALVVKDTNAPARPRARGTAPAAESSFFAKVNAKALGDLSAWVPSVFSGATPYHSGYRVTSAALGRALEEDISLVPEGIMDFGEECGKTPIDIVLEWGPAAAAAEAALWLCAALKIDPGALGWRDPAPSSDAAVPSSPQRPALRVAGGRDTEECETAAGDAGRPLPVIQVVEGFLPQIADQAEAELIALGADIYQHGTRLVRVGRWEGNAGNVERPVGAGVLRDVTSEWLIDTLTRHIRWERYDKRAEDWRRVNCPREVANTLLARDGEWSFKRLAGFVDAPIVTPAGRVVRRAGYDDESRLFLTAPPAIAPVSAVARTEAEGAAAYLFSLIETFPFATRADESAAMALLMTGLLRRILPSAPIGGISASTPGTGKSLLADVISCLATGREAAATAIGSTNEEFEKRLDSVLLKGDAVCLFDNVDRAVKSDVLCQVATQQYKTIRILSQSNIVDVPTNVFLMMTGNNLTLLGDLARRTLMCTLDAGCERPELREFDNDAIQHVLENRASGIEAALTITKSYLDGGGRVSAKPYGSFSLWDRMIRKPLIWCGWPDPLDASSHMLEQDHELTAWIEFITAWQAELGEELITTTQLAQMIHDEVGGVRRYPALHDAAIQLFGAPQKCGAKDLGYKFRAWAGRIMAGMRLEKLSKGKGGVRWRVVTVSG